MREFIIQYKSYADNKWSTLETMEFASFREASYYAGQMQKRFDEKQGPELGVFRAKPIEKVGA